MISHGLNILMALSLAMANAGYPCASCGEGNQRRQCDAFQLTPPSSHCGSGVSAVGHDSHGCASEAGTRATSSQTPSSAEHYLTTAFAAAGGPPAVHKRVAVSALQPHGVFLVLRGFSIPLAIQHLLF